MIEITCNDRLGKKVRVKCNPDDTIGDLKKLIAAQIGTKYDKIILKKWYRIYNDNVTLADCKYNSIVKILIKSDNFKIYLALTVVLFPICLYCR